MTTNTPKLQPVVNEFTEGERSDMARLLIHANDLYQMHNNDSIPQTDRQNSLNHAFELITQVINNDPDNAPAMNLLGRIELDRGNRDAAQALFASCLVLSPKNTQYLTNTGYLHLMNDEPELALEYFQKSLAIDKGFKNAFLGIARAHQALQSFDIAYLHYRSLLCHGYDNITILQGMLHCCEHIQIESYQTELEADLLALYAHEDLAHERLGDFAANLISKKYDLENPNAPIDIVDVANDPLIYYSLLKCSLSNPFVEEFITLLRQSILFEAVETRQLREELQVLAIAIAVHNERNNYALIVDPVESSKVNYFDQILTQTLRQPWVVEDVAGALIIIGMYKAFFSQCYSVNLTALDLKDWPLALVPLMHCSLYHRADREAFKLQFPEKQDELLVARDDRPAPFPRWSSQEFYNQQPLKTDLASNFNVDKKCFPERLLLLVAGKDAAQKAVHYARHFTDVDILAVENNLENLSEADLQAKSHQLSNVVFWPISLAKRFLQDGNQVHFASLSDDSNTLDIGFLSLIQNSLANQGILNIKLLKTLDKATQDIQALVTKQDLKNTSENIRALRSTILSDKNSVYWTDLINSDYFYSIDGCREAWFTDNSQQYMVDSVIKLLDKAEWRLSKVLNHHRKTVALTLAKKHLIKFSKNDQISNEYSIYLVKE